MKIKIENEKCIGCGTCAALAPNTFSMDGEKAIVNSDSTDDQDTVQMTVDSCPTQAIVLE